MRAVAYWPKHNLSFHFTRTPEGVPDMVPTWGAKERPVFWVLATKEEAIEHIIPHMVNEVIPWNYTLKLSQEILEASWVWPETGEFSFFSPWLPRFTDAPLVMPRDFPYAPGNESPAWDIGPRKGRYPEIKASQGFEFDDFSHETFADMKSFLEAEGVWRHEMRARRLDYSQS